MNTNDFPDSIDFWVMQVSKLHFARLHALFARAGLYPGQPPCLHLLWEKDGRSQSELAEQLNIRPATMTKMVSRLEKAGFVRREADPHDQRVSLIYLTEAGRAVEHEAKGIFRQMNAELGAGFSPGELALLGNFLKRLRENLLRANGPESKLLEIEHEIVP
jgi:MarR family transcriptional regulator, organic hydroperoxide resistance regulator